jgi:REP element-mobilizing transposase RayT
MTRYARISCPGGIFHVISRIINDQYLIAGKVERNHYLSLLEKALGRTDAMILGWCLMSNHVHLVIKAGEDSL